MSRDFDGGPRVRNANFFDIGVVGRRTGVAIKDNVKKDADGLDNIDDFWKDDDDIVAQDEIQEPYVSRQTQKVHYREQQLPEELLSTPSSRRSRTVPLSMGSNPSNYSSGTDNGSTRGVLALPGNLLDDDDEYQSPSFHSVKKTLDFSSYAAREEEDLHSRTEGGSKLLSPALDKLLDKSKQKQMAFLTSMEPTLPLRFNKSFLPSVPAPEPTITSKPLTNPSAATTTRVPARTLQTKNHRRVDGPKAFNFGDFEDLDQEGSEGDGESYRASTPTRSTHAVHPSAQTPAEFRRKPATIPLSKSHHSFERSGYDDDLRDDRLRFSDEDEPQEDALDEEEEDDDEEEEPLVNPRRRSKAKSASRLVDSAPVLKSRQAVARPSTIDIPKKSSSKSKVTARRTDKDTDSAQESRSEDDRSVPGKPKTSTNGHVRAKPVKVVSKNKEGSSKTEGKKRSTVAQELIVTEVPIVPEMDNETPGVRKSRRTKLAPLEFWRNEKVVFGRSDEPEPVPVMKAIVRAPPEETMKLGGKRKRGGSTAKPRVVSVQSYARSRKRQARGTDDEDSSQDEAHEDEKMALEREGLKEEANQAADTIDIATGKVVRRVVGESKNSTQFKDVEGGEYQYHRGLEDEDSVVSGTMKIKPNGQKPTNKGAPCSMVFYVIQGSIQVTIHKTEFGLTTGGRFLVPRGTKYSIRNLSRKECLLFFVQTKSSQPVSATTAAPSLASSGAAVGTRDVSAVRAMTSKAVLGRGPSFQA